MDQDFNRSDFANNLLLELTAKNMTQKQLCDATGITESAMSRYVNGSREPRVASLRKICIALSVSADELLDL